MTRKQRRLILIGTGLGVLAVAVALMLSALRDSIVFFNSPSDVVAKHVAPGTRMRLGGLVQNGSVIRSGNLSVRFEVTDGENGIPVSRTKNSSRQMNLVSACSLLFDDFKTRFKITFRTVPNKNFEHSRLNHKLHLAIVKAQVFRR